MGQVSISLLPDEKRLIEEEVEFERKENPRATFSNVAASLLVKGAKEKRRLREKDQKKK